jgi:hypothetical protein
MLPAQTHERRKKACDWFADFLPQIADPASSKHLANAYGA